MNAKREIIIATMIIAMMQRYLYAGVPPDAALEFASKLDSDRDGINNRDDNCISIPNPSQKDRDNDGHGDVCDECPNAAEAAHESGCPQAPETKKSGWI